MKGNLAGLMQQAQKMQEAMQKTQEDLVKMEVTGEAAGSATHALVVSVVNLGLWLLAQRLIALGYRLKS